MPHRRSLLGTWQRQLRPAWRMFARRGRTEAPPPKQAPVVVQVPEPVFAPTSYHRMRLLRQGHGAGLFRRRP